MQLEDYEKANENTVDKNILNNMLSDIKNENNLKEEYLFNDLDMDVDINELLPLPLNENISNNEFIKECKNGYNINYECEKELEDLSFYNHSNISAIGANFLKKKFKCVITIPESQGLMESPDAIGWRYVYGRSNLEGSILIEAKTSRSDFKNDFKKSFRLKENTGMGNWRFYICKRGLIKEEELPQGWGLIYIEPKTLNKNGTINKSSYGKCTIIKNVYNNNNKFNDINYKSECFILTRWLNIYKNPEKSRLLFRNLSSDLNKSRNDLKTIRKELRNVDTKLNKILDKINGGNELKYFSIKDKLDFICNTLE